MAGFHRFVQDVLDERNQIPRSEVGLPDDKIVYSCSNQLYKVCTLEAFAEIFSAHSAVGNSGTDLMQQAGKRMGLERGRSTD
jgi:hypothetical protein